MRILVLSHTRYKSHFKIGSHHYSNYLSDGNDVYFSGIPFTLFHRMLNKKDQGIDQLNNRVGKLKLHFFFPIKTKYCKWLIFINRLYFGFRKKNDLKFDLILCDTPYFSPYIDLFNYDKLIYRPTDDYEAMDGIKVHKHEYNIIKKSDMIFPTSDSVSENLLTRYKDIALNKKMHTIPNGFDSRLFYCKSSRSERLGALYIGAIDSRFDFNALSKLAANFPNCPFNIYGPLESEYIDIASSLMNKHKNLVFHGAIKYEETPALMNKHKVGLLLLEDNKANEGRSPMKLWEYYACGLDILYSTINIQDSYPGMYKYYNYDDMEKKFHKVISKNEEYVHDKKIFNHSWECKCNIIIDMVNGNF
ncbi:glycosyltransferase family protein [Klebsiella sp. 2019SCSN059]|uniref:glycosyltransferase family protein n=1 Tax=Klebsiella sp. 2019SCSN059 TaxID=2911173 RepID=UPI001F32A32C|nr:hypothetical protein [Klebsiella sp. 2019SCSN059]MCF8601171.1 hypothetical protein [Klebsiella sp. 2019SCSN059]